MAKSIAEMAQQFGMNIGELETIRDGILAMVAKVKPSLGQSGMEMDTSFQEVGMDSLTVISTVFEIEEFFGIDIFGRHLETVSTLEDTLAVVAELLVAKRHAEAAA
ncbi:acyl carrier protein [Roseateles sp. SL47]|uniref:acyl carrier protein n=1 Tax=Roseateles sp. SL47 TaxID=2995138 RepID=UPI00226FCB73|nr:acyl carrier protein [Roseateles sp. SL47]WAC71551.1 acyl carrier protein [Roseateles sp. SL47]